MFTLTLITRNNVAIAEELNLYASSDLTRQRRTGIEVIACHAYEIEEQRYEELRKQE